MRFIAHVHSTAYRPPTAQGLDMAWCKAPDAGLPAPDLTIFLDLPVDAAAARGNFGEVCERVMSGAQVSCNDI